MAFHSCFKAIVMIIVLSHAFISFGQDSEEASPLMSVKTGIYIVSVHGLDMRTQTVGVAFWSWFLHESEEYKPAESVEIVNSTYARVDTSFDDKAGDAIWSTIKYRADVKHSWNLVNYPFDVQKLQIFLEDGDSDRSALLFVPDQENSKVDPEALLAGWKVLDLKIGEIEKAYDTTYGDPELKGTSSYSRLVATITLQRKGLRLFFDEFIATYIAYGFVLLMFLSKSFDGKFTVLSASVFSAVCNKYVVDSHMPPITVLGLADKIQWLTFLFIGLAGLEAVIVTRASGTKYEALAVKMNRCVFFFALVTYPVLNIIWVLGAMHVV